MTDKETFARPKFVPTADELARAQAAYEETNTRPWSELTTRKKNMLAKDERYHKEFADLSEAIMQTGTRLRGPHPV